MKQSKIPNLSSSETLQMAETLGTLFSDPAAPIPPEAEALALKVHWGPLLYWFSVQREIPVSEEIRKTFMSATAQQMLHNLALEKLYRRLEQEKIPFAPIKGIDLAFHVFPIAALRLFSDWDIWIRKSDHGKLTALLKKEGWAEAQKIYNTHHWGDWHKDRFLLEPHFTLPNFLEVPAAKLWKILEPSSDGGMMMRVPGSLNLILLFQHSIMEMSTEPHPIKLFLDMEFLLRTGTVDWCWISDFVRKWHLPHPGLFLAAFPEFFRNRWNTGVTFPSKIVSALRDRFLGATSTLERRRLTVVADGSVSFRWVRKHLNNFSRKSIQGNYPQMGSGNLAYFHYLCLDIFRKTILLCHLGNSEVRILRQKKKLIEQSWRCAKITDSLPLQKNKS